MLYLTGTAIAGEDYIANLGQLLIFDSSNSSIDVPVTIEDDSVYEFDEVFFGNLTRDGSLASLRVNVDPASARATIIDEEGLLLLIE